jgi:hypothetical protein
MSTHSFEVPAHSLPIENREAEIVERVDASGVETFKQVPLPATLVENFRQDPSILIEGFEDIVPESAEIRQRTEGAYQLGFVDSGKEAEKRQISVALLSPSFLGRALRRARGVIKPQPELPYTVQIEPANMPIRARQLDLF